tara:strand:+ start:27 stop:2822 length:2796 start_codon:yes stop_codon:yes gene_type:complete
MATQDIDVFEDADADTGVASRIESFLKNIGRGREDPQWKIDLREAVARGEADPGLLAMGVDPLDKAGMLEAAYGPGGFSPAQMLWGAGLLTGAGGIAEAGGKYPEPVDRKASIYEMVTGPRTPSAVENWETGHPWIAGLQTLGAVIPGGAYLKAGSGPVRRGIASIEGNVARFVEPGNAIDEMVRSRLLGDYAGAHLGRSLDAHPMEPPTTLVGQGARATRVADSPDDAGVVARVDDREAAARARQERAQTTSTRRLGTTGQYVGAPRGVTSPQALGRLRSNYIDQVKAGEAGAEWYTDASNWARSVTNSDEEAQQLVDQLAVTSAGANVGTNLGFTVKGLNQAAVGAPVQTGRFPTRQSAQIEAIQGGSRESLGPKITPFADNLSVAWNPRMASQPVHDIWQGRAMGYKDVSVKSYPTRKEALDSITNKKGEVSAAAEIIKDGDVYRIERPWSAGFTDAQHAFMDREMATIVDMLNAGKVAGKTDWTPAEAQAAAWTGAKIRSGEIKPEDAAQHYGSFASRYTAHATTEQAPGVGTGHLEGFLELPQGQREAFALDPRSSWADESGRDSIYAAVGIPTRTSRENVGAFRPASGGGLETNPGVVARPLVSTRETRNYEAIVDGKPTEVYTVGAAPLKDQTFYLLSDKPEITSEVLTPLPKSGAVIPDEGTKINRLKGAKGEKTGELEPESRRILEAGSSLTAYWDVQNAGAAHRLIPDSQNSAGQRTSLNVLLDRKLTTDEVIALDEVAMNNGMFVVDSGRGVRLINDPYSEIGESRARGEITLRKERQGKGKIYDQIINAIDEPADSVKVVPAQIDTAYQDYEDLWSQGVGSGASTSKILDDMDQVPAIRDAVEPAAKRKAAQNLARDAEMAESSGLAVRSDVQEARRIFIAEGFAGLRKALNNGAILPAVAAAVVAPSVLIERNESPQT